MKAEYITNNSSKRYVEYSANAEEYDRYLYLYNSLNNQIEDNFKSLSKKDKEILKEIVKKIEAKNGN